MGTMNSHYADDKVYRAGSGSEVLEVAKFGAGGSLVVSLDSWDAPEVSMRIDRDAALGLRNWINDALGLSR